MLCAEGDDVSKIIQQERHIEVDEPNKLLDRDRRVRCEKAGADESRFLAGVGYEHHRSARPLTGDGENASCLEHRRNSSGIVERAIVDCVFT